MRCLSNSINMQVISYPFPLFVAYVKLIILHGYSLCLKISVILTKYICLGISIVLCF